jgi:hypothetical protein
MSEKTVQCPICGAPYKVYTFSAADQSACPRCVSAASGKACDLSYWAVSFPESEAVLKYLREKQRLAPEETPRPVQEI